ncbi:MAG: ABC transporter permease [Gemmatimonadota bacterium]|nr:ABC transporter permease [Gemmatimonadota bacterium]
MKKIESRDSMLIGEIVSVALGALRANKLRSFLTMLGVVIGVGAVIAVVALGRGAQQSVNARISSLGTTLLSVFPADIRQGGVASGTDRAVMRISDALALDSAGGDIIAVEPEMSRNLQVQMGTMNTNTQILGTTPNYLEVRKYEIAAGRMFTAQENTATRKVVVLGPTVLNNLGVTNPGDIVGQSVKIGGMDFEVVGVLVSKGAGSGFQNPDDQALIPIQTAQFRVLGTDRLRQIGVLASSEDKINDAMAQVQKTLRRAHRLRPGKDDDFQIRIQSDFLSTLGETTKIFTFLLSGIAAVSLLVGGIGIMNIMLVSVTERTREIGVRKALGATSKNILLQFLIEAIVLCMLGGVVGIIFGWGGAIALAKFGNFNTSMSISSVVIAFFFSAFVGVAFGVWPARRAAKLDPIQSLRYE